MCMKVAGVAAGGLVIAFVGSVRYLIVYGKA